MFQVTSLKMLGGMDSHQTVCNIMKTIFTNSVAEKFSFLGAKLKRSFKQLSLYKVVLGMYLIIRLQINMEKIFHLPHSDFR
jgi:hypothetical protein